MGTITFTAVLAFLKKFWWGVPMIALALGLHFTMTTLAETKATLTAERASWKEAQAVAKQEKAEAEKGYQTNITTALEKYGDWMNLQKPIILQSTNTVREYEKTPAGQSVCLDADGVRRFRETTDLINSGSTPAPETSN